LRPIGFLKLATFVLSTDASNWPGTTPDSRGQRRNPATLDFGRGWLPGIKSGRILRLRGEGPSLRTLLRGTHLGTVPVHVATSPRQVRLLTSSGCSRARRTELTA